MEIYFFRQEEYHSLYNCSFYNIDDIPLEKRAHTVLGGSILIAAIAYEMFYIPCIISISKHLSNSAYKFMFFIGIIDMICMTINGIITGYFAIMGVVYCSHPVFIYFTGALGDALWVTETSSAILLAVNRCVEMWSPKLAYTLYKGNRTWFWLCFPMFYAINFFYFTRPLLFSSVYVSWFFNPHVAYFDDFGKIYYNDIHTAHNTCVFLGLTGIYVLFIVLLLIKSKTFENYTLNRSKSQRMSFFQVLLISIVNATAAAVYVFMQFSRISDIFIIIGTFTWLSAHGLPSVIYITMNRTIRNDCRRMIARMLYGKDSRCGETRITATTDSAIRKTSQSHSELFDGEIDI